MALLDAARDLASTLDLPSVLELLLDHLHALAGYADTVMSDWCPALPAVFSRRR